MRAACCGCSPAPGPGGHARRSAPRCAFYPRNPRLPASVTPRPSGTEPYSISPCRPFRQGKAPGLQSPVDCCLTLLPRFRMPLVPADISRREFLELGAAAGLACATSAGCRTGVPAATTRGLAGPAIPPFALQEATIADLQAGMQSGKYTARGLCEYYLTRIDELDGRGPALHSIIETNPEALTTAEQLDSERRAKGPRGPLHGIPVLVKDNIATADRMATTAGSLALLGAKPPADAVIVGRLRARPQPLRLVLGHRRRHRRELRGGWRRHRDRRLDRVPGGRVLARRDQADARTRLPHRHRPDRSQPGHRGADGPDGARCRAPTRGARGRRCQGLRDQRRADRRARLHPIPRP